MRSRRLDHVHSCPVSETGQITFAIFPGEAKLAHVGESEPARDVANRFKIAIVEFHGDNPLDDEGWRPTDNFDVSYFVGPTSFDRRHALVITPTYTPRYLQNRRNLLGQVLGGWEISGKIRWQSGQYLTPIGNTNIGDRRAEYVGGDIDLPVDERTELKWFNTAAFTAAPVERRGSATLGQIEGPHWKQADLSFRERFRFTRRANLELRADVFNVFNMVNFNNPNVTTTSATYGQISGARIPRQSQYSLRFSF